MRSVKKNSPFSVLLYLLFGAAMLMLRYVGKNAEPLSLALAYAMPTAGLSPYFTCALFFLASLLGSSGTQILLALAQAALLLGGFLIHHKIIKAPLTKTGVFPLLALSLSLGIFVAFAPFTAYVLPFSWQLHAVVQKVLIAVSIFLLAAVFSIALRALMKKFLKCRLHTEELVFCALFFVTVGVGVCRLLSVNAYLGIAFFLLLTCSAVCKDWTTLGAAFLLALPPYFIAGYSLGKFFLFGAVCALFSKIGKLTSACGLLLAYFALGYFEGLYALPTELLVKSVLAALLPTLFFILLPVSLLREMENKLVFYREKHLSRVAINRNRAAIGKQLFEISAVFQEIQTTFATLGDKDAETGAKAYMQTRVVEENCRACPHFKRCEQNGVFDGLIKLIDVGALKGKVSLIDLPKLVAENCVSQSNLLYCVNRHLGDYQKYMLETENAESGRALLAGQAQGVSEILRSLALEQSEPLHVYTEKERALNVALLRVGIVCSEVLIYGDEQNLTLSLITFGKADVKKIAEVTSALFGCPMIISERISLSQDKYCCIIRKKPYYDAAFGVSSVKKNGETESGDTHSLIKIDERRFMVALSDGMGSGEYARRISESTVSLLESFYRAKMPSETVLSTVNKLLTFNKEETFACVDIALVDLDSGVADLIKIGSPVGFILSGNTVKVLDGGSLPLGILDALRPDTASYTMTENDVLLFLSDGITDAFGSTSDLYEALKNVPVRNPQQLTDVLLSLALEAYGGVAKDDMTAVAVRLFKNAA